MLTDSINSIDRLRWPFVNCSSSLTLAGVEEEKLSLLKIPFFLGDARTGIKLDLTTPDARLEGRELPFLLRERCVRAGETSFPLT